MKFPNKCLQGKTVQSKAGIQETYQALEALYDEGLIKSIGVSNFQGSLYAKLWGKPTCLNSGNWQLLDESCRFSANRPLNYTWNWRSLEKGCHITDKHRRSRLCWFIPTVRMAKHLLCAVSQSACYSYICETQSKRAGDGCDERFWNTVLDLFVNKRGRRRKRKSTSVAEGSSINRLATFLGICTDFLAECENKAQNTVLARWDFISRQTWRFLLDSLLWWSILFHWYSF